MDSTCADQTQHNESVQRPATGYQSTSLNPPIHAFIDFSTGYKYTRNLSAGPLSSEFDIKYLLCCCHTLLLRQNSHYVCLTYF